MVDLWSKRCDYPGGCSIRASFGPPGGPAARCNAHKEPGMVNPPQPRTEAPPKDRRPRSQTRRRLPPLPAIHDVAVRVAEAQAVLA